MAFDAGTAVVVDSVRHMAAAGGGAMLDDRAAAAVRRAVAGDAATAPFVLDVFAAAAALCGAAVAASHLVRAECALRDGTHYELRLVYAGNCVGALSSLRLAQRVQAVDWWRVDDIHTELVSSPSAPATGGGAAAATTTAFVVDVWRVGAPRPVTLERIDVYARVARGDYDRARRAAFLEPDFSAAAAPPAYSASSSGAAATYAAIDDSDDNDDSDSDGPSVMGGRRPAGGVAKKRKK